MKNNVSFIIPDLLVAAQDAAWAAVQIGRALGLWHNTGQTINADINALLDARDRYDYGKAALASRFASLTLLTQNTRAWVTLARDNLKPHLGSQYSEAWDTAGFAGSLVVPKTARELQAVVQSLQHHFAAHPSHEIPLVAVTAATAQ